MPQIDLEPKERRFYDERTRRWHTRIGRKFARNYSIFCWAVLALIFWKRVEIIDGGDPAVFFGLVALFAVGAGVMMANWWYDLY